MIEDVVGQVEIDCRKHGVLTLVDDGQESGSSVSIERELGLPNLERLGHPAKDFPHRLSVWETCDQDTKPLPMHGALARQHGHRFGLVKLAGWGRTRVDCSQKDTVGSDMAYEP